jgi:hypothetical protein
MLRWQLLKLCYRLLIQIVYHKDVLSYMQTTITLYEARSGEEVGCVIPPSLDFAPNFAHHGRDVLLHSREVNVTIMSPEAP